MKVLTKTAIDETTVATLCSAKSQINKTQQYKGIFFSRSISFRSGSRKTWRVKNAKWQKGFSFRLTNFYLLRFYHQHLPVKILANPGLGCHLYAETGSCGNRVKRKSKWHFCMYIINKWSHHFSRAIWDKSALENSLKNLLTLISPKMHSKSCQYLYLYRHIDPDQNVAQMMKQCWNKW